MKNNVKKIIQSVWIYVLLLLVMVAVISLKKDYHMDEIYSYGLANNVGQTSIHPNYAPYTYDNPADVYLDYMIIEDGEGFDIKNCWYNQERESSPPLYYFAVHIASALVALIAGERFSRWTAGGVNLIFVLLTLYVFRKLLKQFGIKEKELTIGSVFFTLSPAILSIVSFFRMYAMADFAAILITYLILRYRKKENWCFYVAMIFASVFAVLTQYYLIFYLFFISLIYGFSLLVDKEWKKAGKYILSMGIAGGLTIIIFPAIIDQLFGDGRGSEGLGNLQRGFAEHWEYLKQYCSILNKQLFGGLFWIILMLIAAVFLFGLIKQKKGIIVADRVWDVCLGIIPIILYVVIVSKVAPYRTDRYVMAMYAVSFAFLIIFVKYVLEICFANKKTMQIGGLCAVCIVLLLSVYRDFRWPYLYLNSEKRIEKIASYEGADGLCVLDVGWKISGNFNEMINIETMTFFKDSIDDLAFMEELSKKEEYILYAVTVDPEKVIEDIFKICPQINAYDYIGESDYAEIYYLYSK